MQKLRLGDIRFEVMKHLRPGESPHFLIARSGDGVLKFVEDHFSMQEFLF